MKVGDRVAKDSEADSFYLVKEIKSLNFVAAPNSPFERAWIGKIAEYAPLPNTPKYWVLQSTLKPTPATPATSPVSKTSPPTTGLYDVVINYSGEIHEVKKVKAYSEAQALYKACLILTASVLVTVTYWTVYNYLKSRDNSYKVQKSS